MQNLTLSFFAKQLALVLAQKVVHNKTENHIKGTVDKVTVIVPLRSLAYDPKTVQRNF